MDNSSASHSGPDPQSDSVQAFFKNRSALISQENEQRSDHEFRQSLSPIARQADAIVAKIRLHEHETIWSSKTSTSSSHDPALESEELYPGMIFNSAKNHMESTKLWKIVQRMPKGAILHCHLGAMVDLEWVFNQAIDTPGMFISAPSALVDEKVSLTWVDEKVRDKGTLLIDYSKKLNVGGKSIWSHDYEPRSRIPLKEASDAFPGGKKGFVAWLIDRCTMTQTDAVRNHLGVDAIWRKMQAAFVLLTPIIFYEPITRAFLKKFWTTCNEDGVRWVEIRGMTRSFRLEGQEELTENRLALAGIMNEEIEKFKASPEGKGFWGCRLIWDCLRSFPTENIVIDMKICIQAKKLYPKLISGYDLVGPEDFGRTLHSLTPELVWFREQCIKEGLNIPFFFHAGECIGHGDSTDQNLCDAILFGTRRIGHAFSLYKHPLLIDIVKQKQIMIESCPISNEVLRYTSSIKTHPLPALLARGVKAALSNDDPALMGHGTSGLSHDFWQALQGWENLGLAGLGSLTQNSVRWSAFEDQTNEEWNGDIATALTGSSLRAKYVQKWNAEWEQFCEWIVAEFSEAI
ncbi:Metallo-dependent hydrolase [Mollisia scopiformis]|uniref:adenosine deaminase n=1 Tax=Mollisia scopiformis TaxID=149040 RepID=A0A194XIT5_MOLSC|nr:Metallo-dependent hydrolase [Mollisia scopiformis]KUJ20073.1 Metallo-dependent hydrolase [Mollisia scopiformis]